MQKTSAAQSALRKLMNESFAEARLRNPGYSLRAFARRVQLSPSAASEILNGKRQVSEKIAVRVLNNLTLSPRESQAVMKLFNQASSASPPADQLELSTEQFQLISEWHHFGILSLAETQGFRSDPKWIARRLGLRVSVVETALERLQKLGLLGKDSRGNLKPTGASCSSPDGVNDLAVRKAHSVNLDLARRSLEKDEIESRDFSSTTMAIDPRKLPIARKMIREFQDRLCQYLEAEPKNEVYKICVQLFPLSVAQPSDEDNERSL